MLINENFELFFQVMTVAVSEMIDSLKLLVEQLVNFDSYASKISIRYKLEKAGANVLATWPLECQIRKVQGRNQGQLHLSCNSCYS